VILILLDVVPFVMDTILIPLDLVLAL
jgi:hypothetical protein